MIRKKKKEVRGEEEKKEGNEERKTNDGSWMKEGKGLRKKKESLFLNTKAGILPFYLFYGFYLLFIFIWCNQRKRERKKESWM